MLKRSLVFENPVILRLKDNQLVVSFKELPDEKRTIPIEDIGFVLINHPMVSISIPLLNELASNNIAVVFCDEKGLPQSMLLNFDSNLTQGKILSEQLVAGEVLKKNLWKQIIVSKIKNQSLLLNKLGLNGESLKPLYMNVKSGDSDNKEGIAARLYFKTLFGKEFTRDRNAGGINAFLNYGYAILRAATVRAALSSGLFPALGIFHHHRSNAFPLADDIMEPFRPFVDEIVYDLFRQNQSELTKENKGKLIASLYCDTYYEKVTRPLSVGLSITMASLAKCYINEHKTLNLPSVK